MESASGAAKAGRRAYEAEIEVGRLNLLTLVVTGAVVVGDTLRIFT